MGNFVTTIFHQYFLPAGITSSDGTSRFIIRGHFYHRWRMVRVGFMLMAAPSPWHAPRGQLKNVWMAETSFFPLRIFLLLMNEWKKFLMATLIVVMLAALKAKGCHRKLIICPRFFFLSQTSLLILQFSQMAWLGFFIYNCPNSYATTGNWTHVSRVAPNSWDLLEDTLPTELHGRMSKIKAYCENSEKMELLGWLLAEWRELNLSMG